MAKEYLKKGEKVGFLNTKVKMIVGKKGAEHKSNTWKEGDEIECHPNIGKKFAKEGLAELKKGESFEAKEVVEE